MKGSRKRKRFKKKDDKFDFKYVKFLVLKRHPFGMSLGCYRIMAEIHLSSKTGKSLLEL